jgi:hypothetical protein
MQRIQPAGFEPPQALCLNSVCLSVWCVPLSAFPSRPTRAPPDRMLYACMLYITPLSWDNGRPSHIYNMRSGGAPLVARGPQLARRGARNQIPSKNHTPQSLPGKRGGATARSALRLVLAQCRCPRDVGRRVLFGSPLFSFIHMRTCGISAWAWTRAPLCLPTQ